MLTYQPVIVPQVEEVKEKGEETRNGIDWNLDTCGVCGEVGKLICCDECPSAFHAECLGYDKQCPRGKWKMSGGIIKSGMQVWKCYFCKVIKYGIKKVPRMAPEETAATDALISFHGSW